MSERPRLEHEFLCELRADALVQRGERVLVALSGGSDSVALLHLLRRAAAPLDLALFAAHLDHRIRAESGADAEFVQLLCARLEIPLTVERCAVPALAAAAGIGLEEAGRRARQEFLSACAARLGCTTIALAHHRDDQAETVVHRLLRGSALGGLAAMRRRSGHFIRPLLERSKAELLAYLAAISEAHVVDASNADPVFTRNRIRHQLLPAMARFNPRSAQVLASLARCAAREDDYWQEEVDRLVAALVVAEPDGLRLAVAPLKRLHPAQRFRLLHRLLAAFAGAARKEAGCGHVEALDALLASAAPQGELHLPGLKALRRYDVLLLRAALPTPADAPWALRLDGPGCHPLPNGATLQVELRATPAGEGPFAVEFAAALLPFPLTVRTVQPGDRLRLAGMSGRKRIKELFGEQRIPLEERRRMLVLEGDEILWIAGLRRCAGFRTDAGGAVLRCVLLDA